MQAARKSAADGPRDALDSLPDASALPWPLYAEAVVELVVDGAHVVLTPVPDDEVGGAHDGAPAVRALSAALGEPAPPVWVLTAGDPYPHTLSPEENVARNAALAADVDRLGLRRDPALGRASDGSTWEVSLAVRGADRAGVLALAAAYDQLAVYEISDRIRCVDVASATVVTSVAFRTATAPEGIDALVGPTGWRG